METRHQMLIRALVQGLEFLSNPQKVGVANKGGFGTADMTQWRWGALHTVTLRNNVAPGNNIPSPTELRTDIRAMGTISASMHLTQVGRHVIYIQWWSILAERVRTDRRHRSMGDYSRGQDEGPTSPHYADQMSFVENKAPLRALRVDDVLASRGDH